MHVVSETQNGPNDFDDDEMLTADATLSALLDLAKASRAYLIARTPTRNHVAELISAYQQARTILLHAGWDDPCA